MSRKKFKKLSKNAQKNKVKRGIFDSELLNCPTMKMDVHYVFWRFQWSFNCKKKFESTHFSLKVWKNWFCEVGWIKVVKFWRNSIWYSYPSQNLNGTLRLIDMQEKILSSHWFLFIVSLKSESKSLIQTSCLYVFSFLCFDVYF